MSNRINILIDFIRIWIYRISIEKRNNYMVILDIRAFCKMFKKKQKILKKQVKSKLFALMRPLAVLGGKLILRNGIGIFAVMFCFCYKTLT